MRIPTNSRIRAVVGASLATLAVAGIAGCGTGQSSGSASPHPAAATSVRSPTQRSQQSMPTAYRVITILPGMKLGPDGKLHDAFSPATLRVTQGQQVDVTVYNYDNMKHSFTSSALGVNEQLNPSPKNGEPGVTHFTFVANRAGTFTFECVDPCDMSNGGWSMAHQGYMIGSVTVAPQ